MIDIAKVNGRVRIKAVSTARETETLYEGKNTLTYRARLILSRFIASGLTGGYDLGNPAYDIGINAIAIGNGGHLIYNTATQTTDNLSKNPNLQLIDTDVTHDATRVGMPSIGPGQWGYNGQVDRFIPGPSYEKVENGNVPWDGVIGSIEDNAIGVTEPNTTLYSEIVRVGLDGYDDTLSGAAFYQALHTAGGIEFVNNNAVLFRATLPQAENNDSTKWGYANTNGNWISEIGLVAGDKFVNYTSNTNKDIYGTNNEVVYLYGKPISSGLPNLDTTKDNGSSPDLVTGQNHWNIIARSVFPVIVKGGNFSLVFEWIVEF